MAGDTSKPDLDDLVAGITDSIKSTSAVEQAIQKQIVASVSASETVISDLIKTNVPSPDLAAENLKIQKAVIDSTVSAIKAIQPKNDESSD